MKKHVNAILCAAEEMFQLAIKVALYYGIGQHVGARRAVLGDAQDLITLAQLVEKKAYKKAYKFYRNLDTLVRDMVPENTLRFLEGYDK